MSAQHDDAMLDLVAAYAVGAVDATTGECAAVRAHLAECAICGEEFKLARAASAAIGLSASQTPPPALRDRILASLPPQTVSLPGRIGGPPRPPWFIAVAAAAVVVIAASVWWNTHHTQRESWAAVCVAAAEQCHASGTVTLAGAGRLHLQINGLPALPEGKQYQAWVIPPGGAPRPERAFSADERGIGSIDIPEAPAKGAIVAVTIEPAGGSQKPSSQPFLVAKID